MNAGNKTYAFVVRLHHHRDGGVIGKKVGIVTADSMKEAEDKVIEKYMSDNCSLEYISEISVEDGFEYTVYKSSL